jgi:cell division protein FtsZ
LLDNISIQGAAGVLINITGGMDLAIDEVTSISTIIQEAAGDDAEIIFGAVHDSTMKEEIRVTVIATGFDRKDTARVQRVSPASRPRAPERWPAGLGNRPDARSRAEKPAREPAATPPDEAQKALDLQIPTFIRRQMD